MCLSYSIGVLLNRCTIDRCIIEQAQLTKTLDERSVDYKRNKVKRYGTVLRLFRPFSSPPPVSSDRSLWAARGMVNTANCKRTRHNHEHFETYKARTWPEYLPRDETTAVRPSTCHSPRRSPQADSCTDRTNPIGNHGIGDCRRGCARKLGPRRRLKRSECARVRRRRRR